MKSKTREKLLSRSSLSDDDFCLQAGIVEPRAKSAFSVIRRTVEKLCKVPKGSFYPQDDPGEIMKLASFDGWDNLEIVLNIEDELGVPLSGFEPPGFSVKLLGYFISRGAKNMGEWFAETAQRLASIESVNFKIE